MSNYVALYDNEEKYELELRSNLASCKSAFEQEFASSSEKLICVCAPGRVNLIGEHTDYNDGFVLPMAIPLYTVVVGRANNRSDRVCRVRSLDDFFQGSHIDEFSLDELKPRSTKPNWINYIIGVVANFSGKQPLKSFDIVIKSNVPVGSGLSSSAAIEVSIYTFLENLTNEFSSKQVKALACQKAEHDFANVPCGIMDQFISAMGLKGHALLIDCRSYEATAFPLNDPDVSILVTNSNVKHHLEGTEYSSRRKQCESVAKILGKKSLREATLEELNEKRSEMDDLSYRRAKHAITEIERTTQAAKALSSNDLVRFGELMNQSHNSLRDDYNVSCVELDELVEIARKTDGVYGSRMTGGGFGGCTVTLVKTSSVKTLIENVVEKYTAQKASFYVCRPSDGARLLED